MKKYDRNTYKYNYIWEIVPYFLIFGCAFLYIYYRDFLRPGGMRHTQTDFLFSGVMLAMAVSSHFQFFHNRSIVFKDSYVQFNSLFMKSLKKVVPSINVKYESFSQIEAVRFPLIGIIQMNLKADGVPGFIPVRRSFRKPKELYIRLYETIKENNPNIIIDRQLGNYLHKSSIK